MGLCKPCRIRHVDPLQHLLKPQTSSITLALDIAIFVAPHEVFWNRGVTASSSSEHAVSCGPSVSAVACMQAAGLTDHDSDEEGVAAARGHKAQKNAAGGRHPTAAHPSTTAGPSQQPATLNGYQHRADSLGAAEGRTSSGGQDAPMTDAGRGQAAASPQPAGPKIRLKIKGGRWSAGSEDYDDSWFVQHVDRQPLTYGPVTSLPEVSMHAMQELHVVLGAAGCLAGGAWQPWQFSVGSAALPPHTSFNMALLPDCASLTHGLLVICSACHHKFIWVCTQLPSACVACTLK